MISNTDIFSSAKRDFKQGFSTDELLLFSENTHYFPGKKSLSRLFLHKNTPQISRPNLRRVPDIDYRWTGSTTTDR